MGQQTWYHVNLMRCSHIAFAVSLLLKNAFTLKVVMRIAGRQLSEKVAIEMTMLEVNGLEDLDTGSKLVKKTPTGTMGRSVFENGIVIRCAV